MIIYCENIETFSIEFTECSILLIDTEVPDTIFFWFTDFEIHIREMSCNDENFRFLVLFFELSFYEIFECFGRDKYLTNFYHISSL